MTPSKLQHDALKLTNIAHGFFTRKGGASGGIYDSLNCGLGSSDDRDSVLKNRRAVAEALGVASGELLTVHQVHSGKAVVVDQPWEPGKGPEADALVTNKPGIALGILTADCVPILFADDKKGVIGAAHAGWKGAIGGVIEDTVRKMQELGAEPNDIVAVIGPCITGRSYEVSSEFLTPFINESPTNRRFFKETPRSDKFLFDLPEYVKEKLAKAGVGRIERLDRDTCLEEDTFFSYRRTCQRDEKDYGRQVSAIARTG